MTEYKKHNALFFLLIFTIYLFGGITLEAFSYQISSSNSINPVWKVDCKNKAHVGHVSQDTHQYQYSSGKEFPEKGTQKTERTTNCSNSLQIILAANNILLSPEGEQSAFHDSPLLSSQIFTAQEPDPPQIG